jgi:hypothetical protein
VSEFCGCGKPVQYMLSNYVGACNKYMRCPTYEQIKNINFCLNQYKYALGRIANSGVGYYETLAYEAISNIKLIEKSFGVSND